MAARMEDQKEDYYILCGWMSEDDVARFMEEVKDDDKVFVVVEEDRNTYFGDPPVKLQNPKLFKPFEKMCIRDRFTVVHDPLECRSNGIIVECHCLFISCLIYNNCCIFSFFYRCV